MHDVMQGIQKKRRPGPRWPKSAQPTGLHKSLAFPTLFLLDEDAELLVLHVCSIQTSVDSHAVLFFFYHFIFQLI